MSDDLGPIEITCDAPPYDVVAATERLGLHTPLDVRWQRIDHRVLKPIRSGGLFTWRGPATQPCRCGQPLPDVQICTVQSDGSGPARLYLGQCKACHVIVWDEVV